MYLCAELENGVCLTWVEYGSLFTLPPGAGVEIGAALFGVSLLAWGINFLARVILNR